MLDYPSVFQLSLMSRIDNRQHRSEHFVHPSLPMLLPSDSVVGSPITIVPRTEYRELFIYYDNTNKE